MNKPRALSIFRRAFVLSLLTATMSIAAIGSSQQRPDQGEQRTDSIGGLTFSPLIYRVTAKAGEKGVLQFDITGAQRTNVTSKVKLWSCTFTDGTYTAVLGNPHRRDCSSWFKGAKEISQVIKAGSRAGLNVPYQVPTTAYGVYWAMLTFEPTPVGSENSGVTLRYEVPIIFSIGKGIVPNIRVGTPRASGTSGATELAIPMQNVSEGHAIVGASAEIRGLLTGALIEKMAIDDRNILPGTKRDIIFRVNKKLTDGVYKVTANAEIGRRRLPTIVSQFRVNQGQVEMVTKETLYGVTPVIVEPGGFDMILPAGAQSYKSINFQNISNKQITVQLTPHNVVQGESGTIGVGEGAVPGNLGVSIEPKELTLPPKGRAAARVIVHTSPESKGDSWFGISIVEVGNAEAFSQQLLAAVSIKNTLKAMVEVEGLSVQNDMKGNPLLYTFYIKNSGNCNLAPEITCGVEDVKGGLKASLEPRIPGGGAMLPSSRFKGTVMMPPGLPVGDYVFVLKVNYSTKGTIEKRVPFKVTSGTNSQKL